MTTTEEHIAAIRKALEAGPTPGEWKSDDVGRVYARKSPLERHLVADVVGTYADEVFIVSCNPVAMTAVLAEIDRLKAENEQMRAALEPFADIAGESWADKDGWTDAACQKDRVVDWFGPSAFRNARTALKGDTHGN